MKIKRIFLLNYTYSINKPKIERNSVNFPIKYVQYKKIEKKPYNKYIKAKNYILGKIF